MTHICVGNITIIGSDNGLSPGRRHAIIWTNWNLRNKLQWNFSRNSNNFIQEMSSAKWRPFCLGLNVLRQKDSVKIIHCEFEHAFGRWHHWCWISVLAIRNSEQYIRCNCFCWNANCCQQFIKGVWYCRVGSMTYVIYFEDYSTYRLFITNYHVISLLYVLRSTLMTKYISFMTVA